MNETSSSTHPDKDRAPSPFVAELQDRQRAIASGKAEPWNAPVEERRAARRRDMEVLRLSSMEAALHMTEFIAGRLPAWKRDALEGISNPLGALANLNRSIVQITLAEDRFDESAEERAARVVAEAEARAKAEQAERDRRAYTAGQIRRAENKRHVQQAVRAITISTLRLTYTEREEMLADLFQELDAGDAYDRDPVETIAEICLRLSPSTVDPSKNVAGCLKRKAEMTALARAHLESLRGPPVPDDQADPGGTILPFTASAQGPPN